MATTELRGPDLRRAGLKALVRELGPAGMARFLQEFGIGSGDYSNLRHELLDGLDADDWMTLIRQRRSATKAPKTVSNRKKAEPLK